MKIFFSILLTAIWACADESITVLAGGETHGMVRACDCPDGPSGGLPYRAEIIRRMAENGPILLLDAGGFSAGGPYDFYTLGRSSDSLRTLAAIGAMAKMGYDAVAVGDDDLRYGLSRLEEEARRTGLPLVSANLNAGKNTPISPYLLVTRAGVRIGITALTSDERIVTYDSDIVLSDPQDALGEIMPVLDSLSDVQVLLSHLGEEFTDSIAREFPALDLIVNGHRKTSTTPGYKLNAGATVLQFGFQGKRISAARIRGGQQEVVIDSVRWIDVDTDEKVDNAVFDIVEQTTSSVRAKEVLDIYIMSNCPYGLPATADVLKIVEKTPNAEFNIYFIGDVDQSGDLRSLHGAPEVWDEKIWLAVKHLAPRVWPDFLYLRADDQLSTWEAISALGLDSTLLAEWASTDTAYELLAGHYRRSNRLNVDASPTLFHNNRPVSFPVSAPYISRALCRGAVDGPLCDSLPECLSDNECSKSGKLGKCVRTDSSAECVYTDAVTFELVVVVPESSVVHPELSIIQTTLELFPGAEIRVHNASSSKGRSLLNEHNPRALPLVLFSPDVRKAANFGEIADGLRESEKYLTFRNGIMPPHYLYTREKRPGRHALLLDPLFPDSYEVMHTFHENTGKERGISRVIPILHNYADTTRKVEALKTATLWLILQEHDPQVFRTFAESMSEKSDTTGEEEVLRRINVDREILRNHITSVRDTLDVYRGSFYDLSIGEPVAVLFNNREIVPVHGESDLIETLSARPTESRRGGSE